MTSVIDSSELRPVPAKRATGRTAFLMLRVTLGATALAGVCAGAFWLFSEKASSAFVARSETGPSMPSAKPRQDDGPRGIRLAKIEDWPEIKGGVPEIAPARTPAPIVAPPTAPLPALADPPSPPPPVQSAPALVENPPASPPAELRVGAVSPESPIAAAPSAPATPSQSVPAPETPQAPQASAAIPPSDVQSADTLVPPEAPLPPPAPPRAPEKKPKPRPERTAASQRPRPAARPVQAAKVEAAPAAKEEPAKPADDGVNVLGIPLPSGRKIKEAFESVGDAMMKPFRP